MPKKFCNLKDDPFAAVKNPAPVGFAIKIWQNLAPVGFEKSKSGTTLICINGDSMTS